MVEPRIEVEDIFDEEAENKELDKKLRKKVNLGTKLIDRFQQHVDSGEFEKSLDERVEKSKTKYTVGSQGSMQFQSDSRSVHKAPSRYAGAPAADTQSVKSQH